MRTRAVIAAVTCMFGLAAVATAVASRLGGRSQDTAVPARCAPNAKKANLNFTLKGVDGRDVSLAAYQGRVLLLDFWATWCGPCKVEIPAFIDLYNTYRSRGLEVVSVVILDQFVKAKPFAQTFHINYPVLDGVDREDVESAFGPLYGLPTSLVIGRDGRICARHVGLPTSDKTPKGVIEAFAAEIRSLL